MPKRTYTDEDRERARVAWETNGRSVRATARDTGIPLATVQAWIVAWENPPPPPIASPDVYEQVYEAIRTEKKAEVIEAAWRVAKAAFEEALAKLPEASARDAATVAGIAVDKAQLLSGDPTERLAIDWDNLTEEQEEQLARGVPPKKVLGRAITA